MGIELGTVRVGPGDKKKLVREENPEDLSFWGKGREGERERIRKWGNLPIKCAAAFILQLE